MIYRCYRNGVLVATTETEKTTHELEHRKFGIETHSVKTSMGLLNFIRNAPLCLDNRGAPHLERMKGEHRQQMENFAMFGEDTSKYVQIYKNRSTNQQGEQDES